MHHINQIEVNKQTDNLHMLAEDVLEHNKSETKQDTCTSMRSNWEKYRDLFITGLIHHKNMPI